MKNERDDVSPGLIQVLDIAPQRNVERCREGRVLLDGMQRQFGLRERDDLIEADALEEIVDILSIDAAVEDARRRRTQRVQRCVAGLEEGRRPGARAIRCFTIDTVAHRAETKSKRGEEEEGALLVRRSCTYSRRSYM